MRAHILLESQNYESMFNGLIAAFHSETENEQKVEILKINIENEIRNAKNILKKKDRIVWYLKEKRKDLAHRYLNTSDNIRKFIPTPDWTPLNNYLSVLEHFLSIPYQPIQNYQFKDQSVVQINRDLNDLEKQWKEKVRGNIPFGPNDGSEILIDCGENWYWVNLNKAYCSKEAAAMGHCGNEPRHRSSDKILSLRKKVIIDKSPYWEPHLTFILDDGYLTEMKGKGNDKPATKYHDKIVRLLLNPIVQGIVGGGYLPENNFSLADLPKDIREKLLKQKIELGNCRDAYQIYGLTDATEKLVARDFKLATKDAVVPINFDGKFLPDNKIILSRGEVLNLMLDGGNYSRHTGLILDFLMRNTPVFGILDYFDLVDVPYDAVKQAIEATKPFVMNRFYRKEVIKNTLAPLAAAIDIDFNENTYECAYSMSADHFIYAITQDRDENIFINTVIMNLGFFKHTSAYIRTYLIPDIRQEFHKNLNEILQRS